MRVGTEHAQYPILIACCVIEDHPAPIDVRSQADQPAPPIECPKCHTRMG